MATTYQREWNSRPLLQGVPPAVTSYAMIHAKQLVIYWCLKSNKVINERLRVCFGETAPPYLVVTSWSIKLKTKSNLMAVKRQPKRLQLLWSMAFGMFSTNSLFTACVHRLEFPTDPDQRPATIL
jgi:hypothetical protein